VAVHVRRILHLDGAVERVVAGAGDVFRCVQRTLGRRIAPIGSPAAGEHGIGNDPALLVREVAFEVIAEKLEHAGLVGVAGRFAERVARDCNGVAPPVAVVDLLAQGEDPLAVVSRPDLLRPIERVIDSHHQAAAAVARLHQVARRIEHGGAQARVDIFHAQRPVEQVVGVDERLAAERVDELQQIAANVIGGPDHEPVRGRIGPVAGDLADHAAERIDAGAGGREVVRDRSAPSQRRCARQVVAIVSVILPGGWFERIERIELRSSDGSGHAEDDALLGPVGVDGSNDLTARVVEQARALAELSRSRWLVMPAAVEIGLELLDHAALVVVDLPAADDHVRLCPARVLIAGNGVAVSGIALARWYDTVAEGRLAENHLLRLAARLKEATKTVGIFPRFDGLVGNAVAGVVHAPPRADADRLAPRHECREIVAEGDLRLGLIAATAALTVVAALHELLQRQTERRIAHLRPVAVGVGDRDRLQVAIVMRRL